MKASGIVQALQQLVSELDLGDIVTLDDRYRDATQLAELVADADVVLLPYDSRDQATSGVLIEAVAAGVPVVATGFPHAVELLGRGAGLIAGTRTRSRWPGDRAIWEQMGWRSRCMKRRCATRTIPHGRESPSTTARSPIAW